MNEKRVAKGFEEYDDPLMNEPWVGGKPISEHADDGFNDLANELGIADYGTNRANGNGAVPAAGPGKEVPAGKALTRSGKTSV
jgi:hypothetical protein